MICIMKNCYKEVSYETGTGNTMIIIAVDRFLLYDSSQQTCEA